VGGPGDRVLDGTARVVDLHGRDVTHAFLAGARRTVAVALEAGARVAILKDRSPSCGSHRVHDGSFGGSVVAGRGVTAALLERHGIPVFAEYEIDEAAALLDRLARSQLPRVESSTTPGPTAQKKPPSDSRS
jgi:uncharacterized protein YbbK (DUF523 family)